MIITAEIHKTFTDENPLLLFCKSFFPEFCYVVHADMIRLSAEGMFE